MKTNRFSVALEFPEAALPSKSIVMDKAAWKLTVLTKVKELTNGALTVALVGEGVTLCTKGDKVIIKDNVSIPIYELSENAEDYYFLINEQDIAFVL